MNNDIDVFCYDCGHLIKSNSGISKISDIPVKLYINGEELNFCNEKRKARYLRKQTQGHQVKIGKKANYGCTGI